MATVPLGTHLHNSSSLQNLKSLPNPIEKYKQSRFNYYSRKQSFMVKIGAKTRQCFNSRVLNSNSSTVITSATSSDAAVLDAAVSNDVIYQQTFPLQRIEKVPSHFHLNFIWIS